MAGTIKTNAVQLGDSATDTQNFTLRTNVDGTATLARGNVGATTQDILTVDAAGKVTLTQNVQTLTDVKTTPGRVAATPYTNSTGQTIQVIVSMSSSLANAVIVATVDGLAMAGNSAVTVGNLSSISFPVPNGKVYSVTVNTGTPTINNWMELR